MMHVLQQRLLLLLVKVIYSLLQLYLSCSFLLDLMLHDLNSLHHCRSSGHVLLHEPEVFIFLAKARQLILYDCFDFFLRIMVLIIFSFNLLVWVLVVLWLLLG
jgi:hypothetical protein